MVMVVDTINGEWDENYPAIKQVLPLSIVQC